jgi:hypothetical protein
VHELSADMPGQTKTKFKGLLFANAESPQLAGDIEIDSANMRDFVSWLMPEWKEAIATHWSGARGKLALHSKLDYAPRSLRLSDAEFSLDESSGAGDVALSVSRPGGSSIRMRLDSLDLDRYLAEGLRMRVSPSALLTGFGYMAKGANALGDLDLAVEADALIFNGTRARGVKADIAASGEVLDVRSLSIGEVGGARLQISGALEPRPQGGAGSATLKVDAADPRPLFRLFGLLPPAKVAVAEPQWTSELAPLRATLSALLDNKEAESQLTLELRGTAGGSNISLDSTFLGDLQDLKAGRLQASAGIASQNARKLASIFGLSHVTDDSKPAQLSLRLDGELGSGVLVETELKASGVNGKFRGSANELFSAQGAPAVEGILEIDAENGDEILQVLGIASPLSGSRLAVNSKLAAKAGHLTLRDVRASLGGHNFAGQLSARPGAIEIAASANELSAPWLLSLVLMPMDGRPVDEVKLFAETPLGGAKARIVVDAEKLVLTPGIALQPGKAEFNASGGNLDVSISGTGARGLPFMLKSDVAREGNELRVTGSLDGGFELGDVLSSANGEPVIDSLVTLKSSIMGRGRSPAGLAASLSGTGEVSIERGYVRGINADSFMTSLRFSPTAAGVDRLLRQGFTGSDLIFTGGSGQVNVAEGVATFGPVSFEAGGIRGSLKTVLELLSRKIDMGIEVGLKALADVPPIEVIYSGPPRALERTVDASELKARLSAVELKRSMEKLEELQREQMELFAEEERKARAEAAKRAEVERLRATSQANRMRAEEAALRRQREEQEKAAADLLQRDLQELKRRSEVIERQRQEADRQRKRETAADHRDLRSRSVLAESNHQVRRAREAAAEEARKQEELLERQRQRLAGQAARMTEERRKREEAAALERKRLAEEAARRAAEEIERRRAAEEAARMAEEERKVREAMLKVERERRAQEAALKAEEERKAREAEEAARKAEEERRVQEAALKAEQERKAREAEEAARMAEEERRVQEAALKAEQQRKAREAEEAARKAEEERRAQEAALKAEEERKAREAEEAARKAEEERRAQEAALKAEQQRKAREAAIALERQRRAEEEARARQAALLLEQEIKRKIEEERRQAEEAARRAREEERRREAALALERQRLVQEAERKRQEELRRARNLALEQMNAEELLQHQQRAEAWSVIDRRAKEQATEQALEDAKAKIDELLREAAESNSKLLGPTDVFGEPQATKSISPKGDQLSDDMPPAEPLPLDPEEEVRGPTLIDPSSVTSSISEGQIDVTDDSLAEEAAPRNRLRSQAETWLQRLERMIKLPPTSAKREPREPALKKRYNFNR